MPHWRLPSKLPVLSFSLHVCIEAQDTQCMWAQGLFKCKQAVRSGMNKQEEQLPLVLLSYSLVLQGVSWGKYPVP